MVNWIGLVHSPWTIDYGLWTFFQAQIIHMKKLLLILFVIFLILLLIKKNNMTWRQSILKATYPLIMLKGKLMGNDKEMKVNINHVIPKKSFYSLIAIKNNGDTLSFTTLKGKKVIIVNTASDCGYTGQYDELEKLYQQFGKQIVILGFPANDFKEQEKKSDKEIAEFCKINFGVSFQLMKKTSVIKGESQNEVFKWLSDAQENGWCNRQPTWNFSKYVINEDGVLTHFFTQNVSPLSKEVIASLQ